MENLIIQAIQDLGYVGIALVMCLEMVIPIIPSELVMPFAGFAASGGELSLAGVILAGTIGSVTGATILYGVGRYFENHYLYTAVDRYGRWAGISRKDVKRADKWFDDHNKVAVTIGRVIPGIRSAISIPAGLSEMPIAPFLVCTIIGSMAWNILLASLGYFLRDKYTEIEGVVSYVSYAVAIVVVAAVVLFIVRRRRRTAS